MTPLYMKDVLLTIAADNFEAEVSSVTFTPSNSVATWKGLTPAAIHTQSGSPTWTVDLSYAQDWDTVDSLSRYLFAHQGETATITFTPQGTGFAGFSASCVLVTGPIGGQVDQFAEATVSLGVNGQPTAL